MAKYCYLINDEELSIIPERIVKREYERVRGKLANASDGEEYNNVDEIVEEKEYIESILATTKIPNAKYTKIIAYSKMFLDKDFLKKHQNILSKHEIQACLSINDPAYRSKRHEVNHSNIIRIDREDFDENYTTEKSTLKQEAALLKLYQKIHFKDITFRETYDGEVSYSYNELDNANRKIAQVVQAINAYKDLSPYEKFYIAFSYVSHYNYKKAESGAPDEIGRGVLSVLNGDKVVCAGKANMLKTICEGIGIPCIYRICDGHAINTFAINDPKYSLFGIMSADPTNQDQRNFLLLNEKNLMYGNILGINIEWASKLTDKQRNFLMEKSGLSQLSPNVLEKSAQEFRERDQRLMNMDFYFQIQQEKQNLVESADLFEEMKKILLTGKLDYFGAKLNMSDLSLELQSNDLCVDLYGLLDAANEMRGIKNNVELLLPKYENAQFYLDRDGIAHTDEAVREYAKQIDEKLIQKLDEVLIYLHGKQTVCEGQLAQYEEAQIKVGKKVENIASAIMIMAESHQKGDEAVSLAVTYGALIDGAKTTSLSNETKVANEEFWKKAAQEIGANPETILPTADNTDFTIKASENSTEK